MTTQGELHNIVVYEIVKSIVKPPLDAGGSVSDVLTLLETVVTAVVLISAKPGGEKHVMDVLVSAVHTRLAEARLRKVDVAGHA